MSVIITAFIIIFIFGVLIIVHEFGHFWMARARGVRVLEFSIGMGPAVYKKQSKLPDGSDGTKYTVRVLPIGGFCAMEGEDKSSDDPHSLTNASKTSRLLILTAGSVMNLLLGLLLSFVLVIPYDTIILPQINEISPGSVFGEYEAFSKGFTFDRIDGRKILRQEDVVMFLDMSSGREIYISGTAADGEEITVYGHFDRRDLGDSYMRYGFSLATKEAAFTDKVKLALYTAADYCRLVWLGLSELISGRAGVDALAGPVGIGGIVNDVVNADSIQLFAKIWYILDMLTLITLNVGIFNLLPLPALDGGRIVFVLVETLFRKPVPPKYEGYVHGAGLLAFFGLMIFVFYNDIMRLFGI